jgi:hypothetical protein
MAQTTNLSTISSSRFHSVSDLLGQVDAVLKGAECSALLRIARTCVHQVLCWRRALPPNTGRTTPDPKAWRVTRDGDVILPNRKIELRARSAAERLATAA